MFFHEIEKEQFRTNVFLRLKDVQDSNAITLSFFILCMNIIWPQMFEPPQFDLLHTKRHCYVLVFILSILSNSIMRQKMAVTQNLSQPLIIDCVWLSLCSKMLIETERYRSCTTDFQAALPHSHKISLLIFVPSILLARLNFSLPFQKGE